MKRKGYLPHHVIKGFVFWILTICIATGTASAILAQWGTISDEVASQCQVTAIILALGSFGFLIVNFLFGDLSQILFGQEEVPPVIDPAFSARLRNAKAAVPPGTEGADH